MKSSKKRFEGLRRAVMVLGVAAALGAVVAAPARADNDDWRRDDHGRGHRDRDWREHHRPPGYYVAPGYGYYAPPPAVVYAPPPPVVYAPPPVVYAPPPGINLLFNFR
jgi:hypothetical protein